MSMSVSSRHVLQVMMLLIIGLACISLVTNLVFLHVDQGAVAYYTKALLSVDEENNIPSLCSALALLLSALVLVAVFVCYRHDNRRSSAFVIFLAAVFVYLALDEALSLHERLNPVTRQLVPQSEALFTAWVVPGIAFVAVIFFASLQFLRRLDAPTRNLTVISGAIFVAGAIGVETVAWMHLRDGDPDTFYVVCSAIEEFLEMSGVALFIFVMLRHLETDFGGIRISLAAPRRGRPADSLSAGT